MYISSLTSLDLLSNKEQARSTSRHGEPGPWMDQATAGKEVEVEAAKQRDICEQRLNEVKQDMAEARKQWHEEQRELQADCQEVEFGIKESHENVRRLREEKNEMQK
ncbi:hypothetical protein S40288_11383 [Stachybotrys chartarum IBT 40288]|nr:hypothetical protein S40288_11383 [Stachybotrys chartarum IBT 40288]